MAAKRQTRAYTDTDRATALATLASNAGNLAKTSRDTGIPRKTIAEWAKGAPPAAQAGDSAPPSSPPEKETVASRAAALAPAIAGDLAGKLEAIAHALIDAAAEKIEKAGLQQVMVSLGIAVEKMRLLREQSTANQGTAALDLKALTNEQLDQFETTLRVLAGPGGPGVNAAAG